MIDPERKPSRAKSMFLYRMLPAMVMAAAFTLSTSAGIAAERASLKIGDPPPRFTAPDLAGSTVTLPDDAKGRIVIIHFWADWCQFCLDEMPALESLYQRYRSKGLVIYAVNVGQSAEAAKAYVNKVRISYPVLLDDDRKTSVKYEVKGLPRTFFVDKAGLIRYKLLGEASADTLRNLLMKML